MPVVIVVASGTGSSARTKSALGGSAAPGSAPASADCTTSSGGSSVSFIEHVVVIVQFAAHALKAAAGASVCVEKAPGAAPSARSAKPAHAHPPPPS